MMLDQPNKSRSDTISKEPVEPFRPATSLGRSSTIMSCEDSWRKAWTPQRVPPEEKHLPACFAEIMEEVKTSPRHLCCTPSPQDLWQDQGLLHLSQQPYLLRQEGISQNSNQAQWVQEMLPEPGIRPWTCCDQVRDVGLSSMMVCNLGITWEKSRKWLTSLIHLKPPASPRVNK